MLKRILFALLTVAFFCSYSVTYTSVSDECPYIRFSGTTLKDIVVDKSHIKLEQTNTSVIVTFLNGGAQTITWSSAQARSYGYSLDSLYDYVLDILKVQCDTSGGGGGGSGTVTSVSALTIGTTGTDLSSTVANSTTTPVITLNVPTASATNRGALSSSDWSKFNTKIDSVYYPRTYAQLKAEYDGNLLKSGRKYLITDFATIYDQSISDVTKTASVEPIVVTATSDSTLSPIASSTLFPNDVINYDITVDTTYTNSASAKGKITYRKDANGNSAPFDFRKVLMYNTNDASEALIYDLTELTTVNDIASTPAYMNQFGLEFPASILYGSAIQNANNIIANSYFLGILKQNTGNSFFASTFDDDVVQNTNCIISASTVAGAFQQNTNLDIQNCEFNGRVEYGTTGSWGSSTFGGNMNKVIGTNFDSTSVGTVVDRLINCAFRTDTFVNRLYWCQQTYVYNSYVEGEFKGVNSISITSLHADCGIRDIQGISNESGEIGFDNVNIDASSSSDKFEKIKVECKVSNKTIDEATYPELFNTDYMKTIFKGSDGNIYFSYFNGTTYVIREIL